MMNNHPSGPSDIARHYDKSRPRKRDEMLPIRIYHNYVKSVLIGRAFESISVPRGGARVLDLCSGNGGDIGKFKHHGVSYYLGIDLASEAVRRASDRLHESGLNGDNLALNAFSVTCGSMLENMQDFDVCNCQFALHYAFETERTARTCIQNVSLALRPGGVFIGTIPDVQYLTDARSKLGCRFGDKYHSVKFSSSTHTIFGDAYEFSLRGAVDGLVEYVVSKETLVKLCAECDLELVDWKPFTRYRIEDNSELWYAMGVCANGCKLAHVYTSFMFKRKVSS